MPDRTKWENNIKKKLDNRKEPVPGFIWESIEKDFPPRPNLFKRNMNVFRNIAAVFALSAIAVSMFLVTREADNTDNRITKVAEKTTFASPADNYLENSNSTPSTTLPETTQQKLNLAKTETKNRHRPIEKEYNPFNLAGTSENKNNSQGQKYTDNNTIKENISVNIKNEADEGEETVRRDYSPLKKELQQQYYATGKSSSQYKQNIKRKQNHKSKWSVAIEAGNTYNNAGATQSGVSAREANIMLAANQISTYQSMFLKAAVDQSETYTKHHFPITGAITVRKYILDRMAVETGIQYTMLRTDITTGNEFRLLKKQKLQYLGIPVKLSYDIVRIKGFSMYASAGGAFERCIYAKSKKEFKRNNEIAKVETENIDMNRNQWSVNAAVGIQFNPVNFLGIYAEPGLSYFFDDGNNINNIRQEHPLNFQLKAGLRFSF